MFTANCSCSVLREKQHSWQNNLPLGPDLNPRKARESLPCFLVQAIFILSIPWTSYTLVKIGWTCRPRHRKKWKIFSGLLTSFGQKNLWNRLLDALLQRDRKRKAWNNYFYKKKKKGFFSIQKPVICLLYMKQVLFFEFQSFWVSLKTKLYFFHLINGILESCLL